MIYGKQLLWLVKVASLNLLIFIIQVLLYRTEGTQVNCTAIYCMSLEYALVLIRIYSEEHCWLHIQSGLTMHIVLIGKWWTVGKSKTLWNNHIKLIFIRKANNFYNVLSHHFSDFFYAPRENVFEKLVSLYFSKKCKVWTRDFHSFLSPLWPKIFTWSNFWDFKLIFKLFKLSYGT